MAFEFVPHQDQGPVHWAYMVSGKEGGKEVLPNTFLIVQKNSWGRFAGWLGTVNGNQNKTYISIGAEYGSPEAVVTAMKERLKLLMKKEKENANNGVSGAQPGSPADIISGLNTKVPDGFHAFKGINGQQVLIPKEWGYPTIEGKAGGCKVTFPGSMSFDIGKPVAYVSAVFAGTLNQSQNNNGWSHPEVTVQLDPDKVGDLPFKDAMTG